MTALNSPPLLPFLLRRSQQQLNRWIAQSSAAQAELRGLEGRSMIVAIENTTWRIVLIVDQQQVRMKTAADMSADIAIKASLFDLIAMLRAQSLSALAAGDVEFRGNLRIAEKFSSVLRLARPQLEDELAGWIGGLPARALVRTRDAVHAWGTRTGAAIEQDVVEYLQAETRELPRRKAVADSLLSAERLRDDVDRLGQRIDALVKRR